MSFTLESIESLFTDSKELSLDSEKLRVARGMTPMPELERVRGL